MEFSPQQERALAQVNEWIKGGEGQIFRLFGYAGTGKTTLAREVAEGETSTYFDLEHPRDLVTFVAVPFRTWWLLLLPFDLAIVRD